MATIKQARRYCDVCAEHTLHVNTFDRDRITATELLGHGCLTVVTLGLWLPIAIVWSAYRGAKTGLAGHFSGYHCQKCGKKN